MPHSPSPMPCQNRRTPLVSSQEIPCLLQHQQIQFTARMCLRIGPHQCVQLNQWLLSPKPTPFLRLISRQLCGLLPSHLNHPPIGAIVVQTTWDKIAPQIHPNRRRDPFFTIASGPVSLLLWDESTPESCCRPSSSPGIKRVNLSQSIDSFPFPLFFLQPAARFRVLDFRLSATYPHCLRTLLSITYHLFAQGHIIFHSPIFSLAYGHITSLPHQ